VYVCVRACAHPREIKTYVHTETCTQVFIAALLIKSKEWVARDQSGSNWKSSRERDNGNLH